MKENKIFNISKKITTSLALLLMLQVSVSADMTRVEEYHNKKNKVVKKAHPHAPSSSRIKTDNRHYQPATRYQTNRHNVRPQRVQPQVNRRHQVIRPQVRPHVRPTHRPSVVRHRPHFVVPSHRRVGHRVSSLHRNSYRFRHDGLNYRYRSGSFYRPYNNGFRVVVAPLGAIIMNLPIGYVGFSYGNSNYYRYDNAYYQWAPRMNGYRVVSDPYINQPYQTYQYRVGDMIESLPHGSTAVIIDNVKHYEYGNQYFLPRRRAGVRMYLVVDF